MKIGAYDLSSQLNIYSKFSAKSLANIEKASENEVSFNAKVEPQKDTLSLTGGDLFKKATYEKADASGKVVANTAQKVLDDFSLVSAREDKIHERFPKVEGPMNFKEIISDEKMESFLKDSFKLFNAE